jgi:diguanylate cyclase (GGDEF)-like protein
MVRLAEENALLRASMSEMRARLEEMEQASERDALTGLPNRPSFMRALERTVSRANRHGTPPPCSTWTLDGLQAINARHGQIAGDAALIHVAKLLSDLVRTSDFARGSAATNLRSSSIISIRTARSKRRTDRPLHRENPLDLGAGTLPIRATIGVATSCAVTASRMWSAAANSPCTRRRAFEGSGPRLQWKSRDFDLDARRIVARAHRAGAESGLEAVADLGARGRRHRRGLGPWRKGAWNRSRAWTTSLPLFARVVAAVPGAVAAPCGERSPSADRWSRPLWSSRCSPMTWITSPSRWTRPVTPDHRRAHHDPPLRLEAALPQDDVGDAGLVLDREKVTLVVPGRWRISTMPGQLTRRPSLMPGSREQGDEAARSELGRRKAAGGRASDSWTER